MRGGDVSHQGEAREANDAGEVRGARPADLEPVRGPPRLRRRHGDARFDRAPIDRVAIGFRAVPVPAVYIGQNDIIDLYLEGHWSSGMIFA